MDGMQATTDLDILTKHDKGMALNFQKGNNVNILTCLHMETEHRRSHQASLRDGDTMNITFCTFNRK